MIKFINRLLLLQFIRYGFVGGFNTLFSYGIYALALFFGIRFEMASLISIVFGILFSFITQGIVVFKGISIKFFIRYLVMWCGLYFFNIWLIKILTNISLDVYMAGAAATVPVVILAYFGMKYFCFSGAES